MTLDAGSMIINNFYGPFPKLPPTNVHNMIFRRPGAPEIPDHVSQIDGKTGEKRTRQEFLERVYDGATALGASVEDGGLGLSGEKGDMVGILSYNSIEYIALIHAMLVITTPFAPMSAHSTPLELAHLLSKSGVTHIFVESALLPKALDTIKKAGLTNKHIFLLDGPGSHGIHSFDSLVKHARQRKLKRVDVRPVKHDTLAYLMFSSGTSGLPKAVAVSHSNVNASLVQYLMGVRETMKVYTPPTVPGGIYKTLAVLPFSHTYALHILILRPLLAPSTIVVLPKWDINLAIDTIQKYKINSLPIVPSMIHSLVHSERFSKADFSSVIGFGSGAAYLPPALAQRLKSKVTTARLATGYGLSEGTISAIQTPVEGLLDGKIKDVPKNTAGILLAGLQARLVKDDGNDAAVNEPGELWLKGPHVTLGYWNDENATKSAFLPDGWLRTGDRFRIDERGFFFFEDRSKDTLKVSGLQVSPAEIEDVLISHPEGLIIDASVAGVSGSRTSDEKSPRAWVVLSKKGKAVGKKDVKIRLNAWVEENLSRYKWLRGGIQFVDEIPKSATGKVLRRLLVDEYEKKSAAKARL